MKELLKTEEFSINRNAEKTWKKCKVLETLLDTEEDVKQGDISIVVKVRSFNCYVNSIFLYNCETWTLMKTLEHVIDSFQRRLLRIPVLNFQWLSIATNDTV